MIQYRDKWLCLVKFSPTSRHLSTLCLKHLSSWRALPLVSTRLFPFAYRFGMYLIVSLSPRRPWTFNSIPPRCSPKHPRFLNSPQRSCGWSSCRQDQASSFVSDCHDPAWYHERRIDLCGPCVVSPWANSIHRLNYWQITSLSKNLLEGTLHVLTL